MEGRPPMFTTSEDLQSKIDSYFNGGVRTKMVLVGKDKEPMDLPVPTITGLAYFLGFESRQSFYDYEKHELFSYTIKRARLFIETEYEMQLSVGNTTGAIFALKNMGWIDKTHNEVNATVQNTTPITKEELSNIEDKLDSEL